MSGIPMDYYTSMVYQSNSQGSQVPFVAGAPPKAGTQAYRSTPHSNMAVMPDYGAMPMRTTAPMPISTPSNLTPLMSHPVAMQPQQLQLRSPYYPGRPSGSDTYDMAQPTTKVYKHNPYAASCTTPLSWPSQPSTADGFNSPFLSPFAPSSASPSTSATTTTTTTTARGVPAPHSASGGSHPVYAASEASGGSGETGVVAVTLGEQFCAVMGNIPATAMSSRGRHLLLNVLRLRHMDKIQIIYDELAPQLSRVAVDEHGCHVVRTMIELITTPQMEALVPYLEPAAVLRLATATQHTRRVLQAIFEHHLTEGLMPLVEVIKMHCMQLSTNQQGCIVIIRVVEHALPAQKRALIGELVPILPSLAEDQFGNYVVQCILKNMEGYVSFHELVESFKGHWVKLSCDKYSSNVMERIIGMLRDGPRQRIVKELIFDETNLQQLMQNSYGNYVLQAIIGSSTDMAEFKRVCDSVTPFLHTSPYGHRIDAKLKGRSEALAKNATMASSTVDASAK